jgi:hypothetical protein
MQAMSLNLEEVLPMKLEIAFSLCMLTYFYEWTMICLDFNLVNTSFSFGLLERLIMISE